MGVEGLKHYILWHRRCCLQDTHLHDCRVLVDGSNLAYLLYTRAPGLQPAYGGDYDRFAAYVAFFFTRLRECNIDATVIMDGGQPRDNIKQHTCTTRLQTTLETCLDAAPLPPHCRVFPLHARSVFTSVLKRLNVLVLQSDAEADRDLAFLAPHFGASVISNDSDFFLYGARFIPLDFLRYTNLKKGNNKDGSRKYMIPCKVFLHDKFLQLSNLKPRHLGLLGALSGNDCVPVSRISRFHRLLTETGGRKKTHTRRQHVIRYVILFLKSHRNLDTEAVIDKVCDMSGGDGKLRELLVHVTESYRPCSSELSYWLQRRYLPCTQSSPLPTSSFEDHLSLGSVSGSSPCTADVEASATLQCSQEEESVQSCSCETPWQHLPRADINGDAGHFNSSYDEDDLDNFTDAHCEDNDEPVVQLEDRSDVDTQPQDTGDDVQLEDACDGNVTLDDDHNAMHVSLLADNVVDDTHVSASGSHRRDIGIVAELGSASLSGASNSHATEDLSETDNTKAGDKSQVRRKKGRKKDLQDIRQLRKFKKKLTMSQRTAKNAQAEESDKLKYFDSTGMNAEQILRELEKAERDSESHDDKESIDSDFSPIEDQVNEESSSKWFGASGELQRHCGHTDSSLVTPTGFRLPGWLVYGYRNGFVTREISDIVTNSFCISPPQVEDAHLTSCYRIVDRVWKMIVVMVRGGGCSSQVGSFLGNLKLPSISHPEKCKNDLPSISLPLIRNEKITSLGNVNPPLLATSDVNASSSAALDVRARKRMLRKDPNIIRWFTRKGKNLYIEHIALDSLLQEFAHTTPSLQCIEQMTVEERKSVYLHLCLGEVPESFLELPDDVTLALNFICYWYKNSLSNLTENHLLSVLFTWFVFHFIYGEVKPTQKGLRVFCLHCLLVDYCSSSENEKLKFILDSLQCLRSGFNWGTEGKTTSPDKPTADYPKLTEVLNATADCLTFQQLLLRIDSAQCSAAGRAVSSLHATSFMEQKSYNRRFIHSMSEFQACVHYLNILNGLFIAPFAPICMDQIWSGTFCYGVYANLCHLADGGVNLIALLLGPNSPLMQLFVTLYRAVLKVLGLQFPVPNIHAHPETVAENALKALFRKRKPSVASRKKQPAPRKSEHEWKKARAGMEVDGILS